MTDQPGRLVLVTGDDSADVLEGVPENGGSLREVQVDVAVLAERGEQVHLGRGQPGVPEQRQPGRQVETGTTGAQGRDRRGVAQVGRRRVDAGQQPSPQLGLPGEVGVQVAAGPVGVAPLAPVGDEGGPLDGVRREQRREPDRHAVAAVAAHLEVVARQPVARGGRPGSRTSPRRGWCRWWRAAARPGARGPTRRPAPGRGAARPGTAAGGSALPRTPRRRRPRPRAGGRAAGSATAPRRGRGRRRPPGPAGRRAGAPAGPPTPPPAGRCAGPGAGGAPRRDPIRRCGHHRAGAIP